LALNALSAIGEENRRIPITDPAELTAMGFAPDAKNVYRLVGPPSNQAEWFGGASGFTSALGVQLQGRMSDFAYICPVCAGEISNTNPATENFAEVQLDIPDGAVLEFVRTWSFDTNATHDISYFFFELCQPMFGAGTPTQTTLASLTSSGTPGDSSEVFVMPLNTFADSTSCVYRIRARFGNSPGVGPGDSTLRAQKMRVQWRRRVSPAPGVATFPNDVPTGHPFFQFVEALVSAGITAGVAPGTYGVDDPITRGQMAVFLAVALGLDFGY
jgi:hypothetical protein